jgi:hypothetical protein
MTLPAKPALSSGWRQSIWLQAIRVSRVFSEKIAPVAAVVTGLSSAGMLSQRKIPARFAANWRGSPLIKGNLT